MLLELLVALIVIVALIIVRKYLFVSALDKVETED